MTSGLLSPAEDTVLSHAQLCPVKRPTVDLPVSAPFPSPLWVNHALVTSDLSASYSQASEVLRKNSPDLCKSS